MLSWQETHGVEISSLNRGYAACNRGLCLLLSVFMNARGAISQDTLAMECQPDEHR
jgi:hypothetical protein